MTEHPIPMLMHHVFGVPDECVNLNGYSSGAFRHIHSPYADRSLRAGACLSREAIPRFAVAGTLDSIGCLDAPEHIPAGSHLKHVDGGHVWASHEFRP